MTGWQIAHVDVVWNLVACHDGHMLWQHCQIEQRLYANLGKWPTQIQLSYSQTRQLH